MRKEFWSSALILVGALLLLPVVSNGQTELSTAPVSTANEVRVGEGPTGIAFDGSTIWVTNQFSKTVSRISSTGSVLGSYPVGNNPTGVACDGTYVWVANSADNTVTKLSGKGGVVGTYKVGDG